MNYNEFQETLLKELESRLDSHISLNPITTTINLAPCPIPLINTGFIISVTE